MREDNSKLTICSGKKDEKPLKTSHELHELVLMKKENLLVADKGRLEPRIKNILICGDQGFLIHRNL